MRFRLFRRSRDMYWRACPDGHVGGFLEDFCGDCGKATIKVKIQHCPKCGKEVIHDYCPKCGRYNRGLTGHD